MLTVTVTSNAVEGLIQQRTMLQEAFISGVYAAEIGVQADVQQNYLKFPPGLIHQRTGNLLRNIIAAQPTVSGDTITGEVGVGSSAWYGQLLEEGGVFTAKGRVLKHPPHKVMRKSGLAMTGDPYTITFPARPFMSASLQVNTASGKIQEWFEGPIRKVFEK